MNPNETELPDQKISGKSLLLQKMLGNCFAPAGSTASDHVIEQFCYPDEMDGVFETHR